MYSTQIAAWVDLLDNKMPSWDGSNYPTYSSSYASSANQQSTKSIADPTDTYLQLIQMAKEYYYNYSFMRQIEYEEPYSAKFPANSDGMW